MNYLEFHTHCLTNAVPVTTTEERYGLLCEVNENDVVICHGNISFVVKNEEIESIYQLRKGLWASFYFTREIDLLNAANLNTHPDINSDKKIERITIGDQSKFPVYDVTNGVLSIITHVAIPYSDTDFLPFGRHWRRLAWSTEWGPVGDPYFLFARFDPDRIYWGRLEYRPGHQPCNPNTPYIWELMKINNCMDFKLQALIAKAPWNSDLATKTLPNHIAGKNMKKKDRDAYTGPIETSPIVQISVFNNGARLVYIATEEGRRLRLVISRKEFQHGQVVAGNYVNHTIPEHGVIDAKFISFSTQQMRCEIFEGSEPSATTRTAKLIFEFKITMANKELICKGTPFEVENSTVDKVKINIKNLQSSLLNCPGFNATGSQLIPGSTVVAFASFDHVPGSVEFIWQLDSVKEIVAGKRLR